MLFHSVVRKYHHRDELFLPLPKASVISFRRTGQHLNYDHAFKADDMTRLVSLKALQRYGNKVREWVSEGRVNERRAKWANLKQKKGNKMSLTVSWLWRGDDIMYSRFVFAPIERQPPLILHACKRAGASRAYASCFHTDRVVSQQSQSLEWANQMRSSTETAFSSCPMRVEVVFSSLRARGNGVCQILPTASHVDSAISFQLF